MRFCVFILFSFVGLACAFGQASPKPVLYYLKENLIKAPVDVPKGKQLVWEQVYYKDAKLIDKRPLFGRYTANPNEFMAYPYLGEAIITASLDNKEVWRETFIVKRSTNVLYKNTANEVFAEVGLPTIHGVFFETDNGSVILGARVFHATVYPSEEGKCTVTAKYQGNVVWQNTFEVRAFSASAYSLYLGNAEGKAINTSKPLPANLVARVMVDVDSTLRQSIRAYCRVNTTHHVLSRGGKPIATGSSGDGSIPSPHSLGARSGDEMIIQVEGVQFTIGGGCPQNVNLPPISSFTFTVK